MRLNWRFREDVLNTNDISVVDGTYYDIVKLGIIYAVSAIPIMVG
jgi:hypothetical protein